MTEFSIRDQLPSDLRDETRAKIQAGKDNPRFSDNPRSTLFLVRRRGVCFLPFEFLVPVFLNVAAALLLLTGPAKTLCAQEAAVTEAPTPIVDAAQEESRLFTGVRQLTLDGKRAGEGYFSADGQSLVFQSERQDDNPFFQIYCLDFPTGDIERVSPGMGKTTCSWMNPSGKSILFASTHEDPDAGKKQQEEIVLRSQNKQRRYAWDYDDNYELYTQDRGSKQLTRLTTARGYDAEGSWSPDGKWIAFCSNRHAFDHPLSAEDVEKFQRDASWQADIYLMASDGSQVRRLTDTPGYDGGPFFSPDGSRICWRRFDEEGATAEIYTMRVDGSDVQQLTQLKHLSWAPYYHPSGDYLIFSTNRHGFDNFELYLVTADGKSIARATFTPGFDGLASFSPDGKQITWTSNRTANKTSQIFLASWNDAAARGLLGIAPAGTPVVLESSGPSAVVPPEQASAAAARESTADVTPQDILRHVTYLCHDQLAGRLTGTEGERLATEYVASYMEQMGLVPAGDNGTYFQEFGFTAGVALGDGNQISDGVTIDPLKLDKDWRPLAFSDNGSIEPTDVVFAGYGITAPAGEGQEEYDSYVHLDVTGKWVLVLRYLPEEITPERRQHLAHHASLRRKAMVAREKGAKGILVATGPRTTVKERLVPLQFDGSMGGSGLPAISISDDLAQRWLTTAKVEFGDLQKRLDSGEPAMGVPLPEVKVGAAIDIQHVQKTGRNVLGRMAATSAAAVSPTDRTEVMVGAHVDHLGRGSSSSSLARDEEAGAIHYGADDNASGVAAMLEMVQSLARMRDEGKLPARRDIVFSAWSGEELGLLGSSYFAKSFVPLGAESPLKGSLYPSIAAYVNLDMVGRLDKKLILQGTGSSSIWPKEIEQRNASLGIPITLQDDGYLPTDSSTFYTRGVPILSAFTGSHSEYHTPRDKPNTLNYEGAAQIARLLTLITRSLALREEVPDFIEPKVAQQERPRAALRAYLGTIPDYAESEVKGVQLSGVAAEGPAGRAGIRGGDVIIKLAGRKIENIYDYTFAIEALKVGEAVEILVRREDKEIALEVTPGSRE